MRNTTMAGVVAGITIIMAGIHILTMAGAGLIIVLGTLTLIITTASSVMSGFGHLTAGRGMVCATAAEA